MNKDDDLHLAKPGSFFGVYILYNINPKYKGRVYIGFTVNPARRIRQHNREIKGGAAKTGRIQGPWDMVLITHGFSTKLAALQFEWAWQNPLKSRRLSHLARKKSKETLFTYRIRILSEMLNTGPWNRLPLTMQWLKQDYFVEFPLERQPPAHMPIAYGEIKTVRKSAPKNDTQVKTDSENIISSKLPVCIKGCMICDSLSDDTGNEYDKFLNCIVDSCDFVGHTKCLAQHFLEQSNELDTFLIPIRGKCPSCNQELMWCDMIKQKKYTLDDLEFCSDSQTGDETEGEDDDDDDDVCRDLPDRDDDDDDGDEDDFQ